jgi:integrase/recombinase XerC
MAGFTNEYREKVKENSIGKVREMLSDMPEYVRTYINGISQNHMETTLLAYLTDIHTFLTWLCVQNPSFNTGEETDLKVITTDVLESLRSEDFEEYLSYLDMYDSESGPNGKRKNGVRSKRRKFSAIRSLYAYLFKNDKISTNPILKVDMPDSRALGRHEVTALEPNEAASFMDAVEYGNGLTDRQAAHHGKYKKRDLAIVTVLLSTGIRVSECVGLDIDHINLEEMKMTVVRKGGFNDEVYYNEETYDALVDYLEERKKMNPVKGSEKALFLSNRMSRITVRSVEMLVAKYAKSSVPGKHIKVHSLRSSCATAMIESGEQLTTVKDILGHASVSTTQLYIQDSKASKRRAATNRKIREQ